MLALVVLAGVALAADPAPSEVSPPPVEPAHLDPVSGLPFSLLRARLANGFELYVQPRPDSTSATGYLVFRAGGRYESPAESGASHLLEHLLFTGTERWTEEQVRATIDLAGGRYNGFTGAEQVGYWAQVPAGRTPELLDWLGQVAFHPKLDPAKLDTVRNVVFEERGGRQGWTVRTAKWLGLGRDYREEITTALFPGSSRGQPIIGDDESLDAATIDTLRTFYGRHYHAGNASLVYVGPTDPGEVLAAVESVFGSLPGGERLHPPDDAGPADHATEVRAVWRNAVLDRCTVTLAARGPGLADADRWPGEVLLKYLEIELFETLRMEQGLTYGVSAWNETNSDGGQIAIDSTTDCANVGVVADTFVAAVARVGAGTVDVSRLERAKGAVSGRWALSLENNITRASWVADLSMVEGGLALADAHQLVPRVGPDDLTRLASTWLPPGRRSLWVSQPIATVGEAWLAAALAVAVGGGLLALLRWRRRRA